MMINTRIEGYNGIGLMADVGGDPADPAVLFVIGRVERVCFDPACDPLLFLQGRYRCVHVARDDY